MDDFESSKSGSSGEASTGAIAARPAGGSAEERNWQDRRNDAEMKVLDAQLRAALDDKETDAQTEVGRQQGILAQITEEGTQHGFHLYRSPEVVYREKYVKLRSEMIKEEKLHPGEQSTQDQEIYTKSRVGTRNSGVRGMRGTRTPLEEKKTIKGKESKLDKLAEQLDALSEEGRRAGVPARVFQD